MENEEMPGQVPERPTPKRCSGCKVHQARWFDPDGDPNDGFCSGCLAEFVHGRKIRRGGGRHA